MDWYQSPYWFTALGINKCRIYHEKMAAFYQRWNDITIAINTICGTGAFFTMFFSRTEGIGRIIIGAVAVASALESAFKPSRKARRHDDLRRRFSDLYAKLIKTKPTSASDASFKARRFEIEKDEPPVRRLIDIQSNNEAMRSVGYPESSLVPLTSSQRIFGYFFDFGLLRLEKWKSDREKAIAHQELIAATEQDRPRSDTSVTE